MEVFGVTNSRYNEQISPVPWHFVNRGSTVLVTLSSETYLYSLVD